MYKNQTWESLIKLTFGKVRFFAIPNSIHSNSISYDIIHGKDVLSAFYYEYDVILMNHHIHSKDLKYHYFFNPFNNETLHACSFKYHDKRIHSFYQMFQAFLSQT